MRGNPQVQSCDQEKEWVPTVELVDSEQKKVKKEVRQATEWDFRVLLAAKQSYSDQFTWLICIGLTRVLGLRRLIFQKFFLILSPLTTELP